MLVKLPIKVGGLLDQGGGNFRVLGRLAEVEKDRCLTREILSTDHWLSPLTQTARHHYLAPVRDLVPAELYKSEPKKWGGKAANREVWNPMSREETGLSTLFTEKKKKAISGRIGSAGPPALGTPAPAPEKIFLKKSPASAYSCVARAPDLPRRGGAGPVRALRNLGREIAKSYAVDLSMISRLR